MVSRPDRRPRRGVRPPLEPGSRVSAPLKPPRVSGVGLSRASYSDASAVSIRNAAGGPFRCAAFTPSPLCGFTAAALAVLLAGCDAGKSGTETASATVTDSAAATVANTGAIPITSASDEARRLYLEGRALAEQLRAHDGRQLFEQAAAKDPTFAMAHYQLAANSATAKDFFAHLKEAVGAGRPRRPRASG